MRTKTEHDAINRMLNSHGLGSLEEGTGLLSQLGFLVVDHEHFRSLLVRCEPENRSSMYDSLKPYLRFQAKPLDVYIAESARLAEQQQLPTVDADGNYNFSPSLPPNVGEDTLAKDIAAAQAGVDQAFAKYHLEVVCMKCTKSAVFSGVKKGDAIQEARRAGWSYWEKDGKGREICPACPAPGVSLSREEFQLVNEFKMQPMGVISQYFGPCGSWTRSEWDAAATAAAKRWAADGKPTVAPTVN
jgi:hypothetical protein